MKSADNAREQFCNFWLGLVIARSSEFFAAWRKLAVAVDMQCGSVTLLSSSFFRAAHLRRRTTPVLKKRTYMPCVVT